MHPKIICVRRNDIVRYWDILENDDVESFKNLIKEFPVFSLWWMDGRGNYPIHSAALHDQQHDSFSINILQYLIDIGHDVNMPNLSDMTPLHNAVYLDNNPVIPILIKNGSKVNSGSGLGYTPLMEAVSRRNIANVKTLLDNGADPSLVADDGTNALKLCEKLPWSGPDANIKNLLLSYGAKNTGEPVSIRVRHKDRWAKIDVRDIRNDIKPLFQRAISTFNNMTSEPATAMGLYASVVNGFVSVMAETGNFSGSFASCKYEHLELLDIPTWREAYDQYPRWELVNHNGKATKTKYAMPIEFMDKYLFDMIKAEIKCLIKDDVFNSLYRSNCFKTGVTMWMQETTYSWKEWPSAIYQHK